MGKLFIKLGIIMVILGLLLNNPTIFNLFKKLGHLPGDIVIKKENFSFYFPITSAIIVSVILTIVFSLLSKK